MKDPRLAAALLASSPDALAELFDAYGDRLFRYCWSMLRSRELAQVALRDTLLVAQAHIARLADPEDPESLGPWLYSLARAECRRHQAVAAADADESPARPGLPAADARLMSWHAAPVAPALAVSVPAPAAPAPAASVPASAASAQSVMPLTPAASSPHPNWSPHLHRPHHSLRPSHPPCSPHPP